MLRLILLLILSLLSLLAICRAPTYHLWLASIVVTEFPLILIAITSLILFSGLWVNRYQVPGTILGLLALFLFLSPIVRAYLVSKELKSSLDNVDEAVFSVSRMIMRSNNRSINPLELSYTSYSDKDLNLDYYPSKVIGNRPCIIVVHGGSWKSGDNKQLPELNSYLAAAGYHVAAINYRLAPEYKSPLPVDDVRAAILFLRASSKKLKIDTTNFVLLGRSAGAQIALLAAYTLNDPGIKGVVDFYGPADMVWGYSVPANPLVMNSRKVMEDYLGGKYEAVPRNYHKSSPVNYVMGTSVPTLIIHGNNDVLVAFEHSTRLKKKLIDNKVKHYFLSLPWATHGFDYTLNGPGGQLSTFAVKRFVEEVTK
ncbi:MAG TPA: alpha/beta hydrolase [Pedobacter sp.]|jgi:acetyl esterase/lipase